jgi:hypothetical protein
MVELKISDKKKQSTELGKPLIGILYSEGEFWGFRKSDAMALFNFCQELPPAQPLNQND